MLTELPECDRHRLRLQRGSLALIEFSGLAVTVLRLLLIGIRLISNRKFGPCYMERLKYLRITP